MSGQKKIGFNQNEEEISREWDLKKNEPSDEYVNLIKFLQDHFSPAEKMSELNCITHTTAEVFDMLQSHLPSDTYKAEDVYQALETSGFKYHNPGGGLDFVWLLKSI
jgi:hypothetical protein